MKKVNFYAVEFKYSGNFDDYSDLELFELARGQSERGLIDCFDYAIEVEDAEAEKLDGTYSIENKYPGNKLAVAHWCYIDETEEDEDDEEMIQEDHEMNLEETISQLETVRESFEKENGACPVCIYRAIELLKNEKESRKMTISELIKKESGNYDSFEVYKMLNERNFHFHTDSIKRIDEDLNLIVKEYEIMNEERYNETILANCSETANFAEWYDNKSARILVIAV